MQNTLKELATIMLLAGFGGFVRALINKVKFRQICAEIIIAIFTGLIVYYFFQEYHISNNLRIIAVSLAGYSSRGIILVLDKVIISKCKELIGIFCNKDESNSGSN